jgi:hypothetical protein
MFMCENVIWMDLIMLECKGLNVVKTSNAHIHVAKARWQDKKTKQIFESIQFMNTMCASYNHHFLIYNKDKTKVTL